MCELVDMFWACDGVPNSHRDRRLAGLSVKEIFSQLFGQRRNVLGKGVGVIAVGGNGVGVSVGDEGGGGSGAVLLGVACKLGTTSG